MTGDEDTRPLQNLRQQLARPPRYYDTHTTDQHWCVECLQHRVQHGAYWCPLCDEKPR